MAFFDAKLLPKAKDEYVCFMDIMGIQSKMSHSINQTSNFIFKFHSIILETWRKTTYSSISVYPIMDGAYITSNDKKEMLNFITYIFNSLMKNLLDEKDFRHWFLVRAALAYGKIIHGRDIPYAASYEFATRVGYKEKLLIGAPMISAYQGEENAAPMGVFIDDSATIKHQGVKANWCWYDSKIKIDHNVLEKFVKKVNEYYKEMDVIWSENEYKPDRRKCHLEMFNTYYKDI